METNGLDIPSLFGSLHEGMAQNAHVKTVYGEPIVSGDKTVIPVARIGWGFGGGMGRNGKRSPDGNGNEGGGGGGGMAAVPVGVVEISPQSTRFIRFSETRRLAGALVFGILLGMWIGRRRRS